MAIESVVANAGSGGSSFAADSITGGVLVPYCKLMSGADTSEALIGGDATNGLDVDVTRVSGTVTVDGTGGTFPVSGTLTAVTTVSTVTNLAQMSGVAIAMGTGVRAAGVQRVTIATDDVVPASQSGTWNITNVSGTITLPTGASTAAKQPALGTAGTASADVISVQGIASMTPLLVTATLTSGTTTVTQATGTNLHMVVDSGTVTTVSTVTTLSTLTGGGVAHDGADSGNPVKVGGRAVSAEIAAVANNDRSDFITDLVGKQITLPYANPENFVSGCISTAMTGTTSTSLLAAPAAGLRNYITQITVSCAHATQGTDVLIQDGSGGTTLYVIPAAAVYGGAVVVFPTPLRQPTTATAIFCANVTTGSSTKVSASGYKGA